MRINAKYIRGEYKLSRKKYVEGQEALVLVNSAGEQVRASIALPAVIPEPGHVFIKSYSENEGLVEELVRNGIVEIVRIMPCGFTQAHYCKVLI